MWELARAADPPPLISVLYPDNVRAVLNDLLAAGLARREGDGRRPGYRWFAVRQPLAGPIADLDRAMREGGTNQEGR
jgi:hypothetical protein